MPPETEMVSWLIEEGVFVFGSSGPIRSNPVGNDVASGRESMIQFGIKRVFCCPKYYLANRRAYDVLPSFYPNLKS
jgi:hypothetical protein